jgi:hypothetical protein
VDRLKAIGKWTGCSRGCKRIRIVFHYLTGSSYEYAIFTHGSI